MEHASEECRDLEEGNSPSAAPEPAAAETNTSSASPPSPRSNLYADAQTTTVATQLDAEERVSEVGEADARAAAAASTDEANARSNVEVMVDSDGLPLPAAAAEAALNATAAGINLPAPPTPFNYACAAESFGSSAQAKEIDEAKSKRDAVRHGSSTASRISYLTPPAPFRHAEAEGSSDASAREARADHENSRREEEREPQTGPRQNDVEDQHGVEYQHEPRPSQDAIVADVTTDTPLEIPSLHMVEAYRVDETGHRTVYDAVPVEPADESPWWKKHRNCVCMGVIGFLIAIVASVAVGVTLGSNNGNGGDASSQYGRVDEPTITPTLRPSQSSPPSLAPSAAPSSYLSTLEWKQLGQTIAGNSMGDRSGTSVALSSDMLAIGSPGHHSNFDRPGSVRIYRREGNSWELAHTLFGDENGDRFGQSLSLSTDSKTDSNILAVSGPGYTQRADREGYVKVFQIEDDGPVQLGQTLVGEDLGDQFGFGLASSSDGNIVAVGASHSNGTGRVTVYRFDGSWKQLGQKLDSSAAADDNANFGRWVSLSGDGTTLSISAHQHDWNGMKDAGHAIVYYMDEGSTTWQQHGQELFGEETGGRFGYPAVISSDGSTLFVGAHRVDTEAGVDSGQISIYRKDRDENDTGWTWKGHSQINGEAANDYFGFAISPSIDGSSVAVGGYLNDGENGDSSGHVRVYKLQGLRYQLLGNDIDGMATFDDSGRAVSLSGDGRTVAIGSRLNDDNGVESGHVRVFTIDY